MFSDTDGGQFDVRENCAEVIYSSSDQDADSGDNEDAADWDRRAENRESSERKVSHEQRRRAASRAKIFSHLTLRSFGSLGFGEVFFCFC